MTRRRLAFLVAPFVAVVAFWGATYASVIRDSERPLPSGAVEHSLFFFLLFGLPIAYVGTAVLAMPLIRILERRGRARGPVLMVSGAGVGAVWLLLLALTTGARGGELLMVSAMGALAGLAGGAVFAALGRRA
jgi:hypothetical protein